jgi:hypothetical protein
MKKAQCIALPDWFAWLCIFIHCASDQRSLGSSEPSLAQATPNVGHALVGLGESRCRNIRFFWFCQSGPVGRSSGSYQCAKGLRRTRTRPVLYEAVREEDGSTGSWREQAQCAMSGLLDRKDRV